MTVTLDGTDWRIVNELQHDGRVALSELARRVHLSASATTDRVRRLETAGVITGYSAHVDLGAVGYSLLAVVRLKYRGTKYEPFRRHLDANPHILECLRITGEDCYILKVAAASMPQLEQLLDRIGRFGDTTTSLVYSQTLPQRGPQQPPAPLAGEDTAPETSSVPSRSA